MPLVKWNSIALCLPLLWACKNDYEFTAVPVDVNPGDITECDFTPISGTQVSRYDCNPVFSSTDEVWGSTIRSVGFRAQMVLGHPFYQVWYVSEPEGTDYGDYGVGYAVSSDGTTWEAYDQNPVLQENGGWDRDRMDAVKVVWDPTALEYYMLYQGYTLNGTWGLGLYRSEDGINWTENSSSPLLDLAKTYNGVRYCWPLSFGRTSTDGFVGYLAGGPAMENICEIYGFRGHDMDATTLDLKPTLKAGPERYDQSGMTSAASVEFEGQHYLFYGGFEEWTSNGNVLTATNHNLNLATSSDGYSWTKSPDNPLPVMADRPGEIMGVAAQVVGKRIHLWITDYYPELGDSAVGYFIFEPGIEAHP
jgi:hypothetical protein